MQSHGLMVIKISRVMNRFFLILIALIVVLSCCKEKTNKLANLNGKINKIIEKDSTPSGILNYEFTFIYDSTNGLLERVLLDDKNYIELDCSNYNNVELIYNRNLLSYTSSIASIRAYKDSRGYINNITLSDSLNPIESDNLLVNNASDNTPDSIREFLFPSLFEYSLYTDFGSINLNTTRYLHKYNSFFTGERKDTIINYYSSINYQHLPLQAEQIGSYYSGYATISTNPTFLLGLNNYLLNNYRDKLIDSVVIKTNNQTYTSHYHYTFNSLNQVTKVKIIKDFAKSELSLSYY